jgi:hypothetical protein
MDGSCSRVLYYTHVSCWQQESMLGVRTQLFQLLRCALGVGVVQVWLVWWFTYASSVGDFWIASTVACACCRDLLHMVLRMGLAHPIDHSWNFDMV